MIVFISLLIFLFIAITIFGIYSLFSPIGYDGKVKRRLAALSEEQPAVSSKPTILRDDQMSEVPLLNRVLERFRLAKRLELMINQADLSLRVGELVLLMLVLGGVTAILIQKLSGNILLLICLSTLCGSLPILYVLRRRQIRFRLFSEQFPDALDLMISSLRAGHAFSGALQMVADEAPDPIGMEFRKTFEEQNLGLPTEDAMKNLTDRINHLDLKFFVTAVLIQRETGGNLVEVLSNIGYTIRERFKILGQLRTYTAQGRLSGWILGILPIAFGLIIYAINPDYIMILFREEIGQYMIAMALVFQLIGFVIIRRIISIKM